MLMKRRAYAWFPLLGLLAEAGDGAGGAGTGGGAAGAGAGAGAAGAGDGGTNAGAGAPGAGGGSVLSAAGAGTAPGAGAGEPGAGGADPWAWVPEKFQVKGADGALDHAASALKVEEHRKHLEQRLGTGDIRPKTADEYTITPPEALKDFPLDDPGMKDFKAKAHEAGLTQKQLDLVMGKYFELAPQLVAGAQQLDQQTATAELQKVWSTPEAFTQNAQAAFRAVSQFGGDLVQKLDQKFGNDPDFIQFAARVGAQLREDSPPGGIPGGSAVGAADVKALMSSEAYSNPRHPEHQAVTAKVNSWYARQPGASQPLV